MSKKSKSREKNIRKKAKKTQKERMQAQYVAWREAGQNQKSTELRRAASQVKKMRAHTHPNGHCGNIGCTKCSGYRFKAFLTKGKALGMPQSLYLQWIKLSKEEQQAALR